MRSFIFFILALPAFAANFANQVAFKLDAGVKTFTITNSGSVGGSFAQSVGVPAAWARVGVVLTPGVYVPPTSATTYATCVDPCGQGGTAATTSINMQRGQIYRWLVRLDSGGTPVSPFTFSQVGGAYNTNACGGLGTLPMVEPAITATAPLPMPREVIGQDCYVDRTTVPLLSGHASTGLRWWVRVHSPAYNSTVKFDNKISLQVNSGAWIDFKNTNSAVVPVDEMRFYSHPTNSSQRPIYTSINAIGGYAQVREYIVALPNGTIGSGDTAATAGLRFNGSDGQTSGFSALESFPTEGADKTISQIVVTSNEAVATSTSHGFSNGDYVVLRGAPDMRMLFNGPRLITAVTTNTFSFTPCGTGNAACTSPNDTYTVPVNRDTSGSPGTAQPVMYATRMLVAASAFTQTDPSTWSAPGGGDATRGGNLFKWGNVAGTPGQINQMCSPVTPYLDDKFKYGTCGGVNGCHTTTGKDLKYYAASNHSIQRRSEFHCLSEQDGLDIATYIRGLSIAVPAKARMWNPPFQPGPGISTGNAHDWAAGCGVDCVLTYGYDDLLRYLAPGGDKTKWAFDNKIDVKDLPIPYQMPDWKLGWLPAFFPADTPVYSSFLSNVAHTYHQAALSSITPGDFTSYKAQGYLIDLYPNYGLFSQSGGGGTFDALFGDDAAGNWPGSAYPLMRQSVLNKSLMALWEFSVEYGLAALDGQRQADVHGAATATGCYVPWQLIANGGYNGQGVFNNGPHKTPMSVRSFFDGMRSSHDWASNIWYVLGVITQSGNCWDAPNAPLDRAYLGGYLFSEQEQRPTGYMGILYHQILATQAGNQRSNLYYHPTPGAEGLDWTGPLLGIFYPLRSTYHWFTTAEWTTITDDYLDLLNGLTASKSAATWSTVFSNQGYTCCNAAAAWAGGSNSPGDYVAMMLPLFKVWGANSTKLTTFLNWAKSISYWSGHNFDNDIAVADEGNAANGATGDLSVAGNGKTITFTTCPANANTTLFLTISGGTGTTEILRPISGTCTAGNPGTMVVNTQQTHTGGWTAKWGCFVGGPPNYVFGGVPSSTQGPNWWQCSTMN